MRTGMYVQMHGQGAKASNDGATSIEVLLCMKHTPRLHFENVINANTKHNCFTRTHFHRRIMQELQAGAFVACMHVRNPLRTNLHIH